MGELIGTVSPTKNGLMSMNGFIDRGSLVIPSEGDANDLILEDLKDGYYTVTGTGSPSPLQDYATLIRVKNCALFIPRNTKGVIYCSTRDDSKWSKFYKFTGIL